MRGRVEENDRRGRQTRASHSVEPAVGSGGIARRQGRGLPCSPPHPQCLARGLMGLVITCRMSSYGYYLSLGVSTERFVTLGEIPQRKDRWNSSHGCLRERNHLIKSVAKCLRSGRHCSKRQAFLPGRGCPEREGASEARRLKCACHHTKLFVCLTYGTLSNIPQSQGITRIWPMKKLRIRRGYDVSEVTQQE